MAVCHRQGINLHKWLVCPIYLVTIGYFGWRHEACATALLVGHTLYTLCWLFKDIHYPDLNFHKEAHWAAVSFTFAFCLPYYLPMFCVLSNKCFGRVTFGTDVTVMGVGMAFYTVGTFFHFGSDCQKSYVLLHKKPKALITDGFFTYTRNPNYFGETLIFASYAIWSRSLMVIGIFLCQWVMLFLPNMLNKEKSMSRYPEFKAWQAKTGFIFPWLPSMFKDFATLTLNNPNQFKKDS